MTRDSRARRLRVLTTQGGEQDSANPYLGILARHTGELVEVSEFSWARALFGRYDAVHLHWPEALVRSPSPAKHAVKLALFRLLVRLDRARRRAHVSTIHNLAPHESGSDAEDAALRAWLDSCQVRIYLTQAGLDESRDPRGVAIPHGDYAEFVRRYRPAPAAPTGEAAVGRVLLFGMLRRYKGVEKLIEAFRNVPTDLGLELLIAGKAIDDAYEHRLVELAADAPAVTVQAHRFLGHAELIETIERSELVILPYDRMYNSGAALMALTLGRPVAATGSPSITELAAEFGPGWVQPLPVELTGEAIGEAVSALRSATRGAHPDWSARTWPAIAGLHQDAYRRAVVAAHDRKSANRTESGAIRTRRARVFVHLDYGRTPEEWKGRFAAGRAWEQSPYSLHTAAGAAELSYSRDSRESRVGRLGRRALARALGFDLAHAFRNRAAMRAADAVWTHTEREFLAVCLLRRVGLLGARPPKLLAQSVWLYDAGRMSHPLFRRLYLWLMRAVDIEIVHSEVNAAVARELPLARPVYRVPYGSNAFAGHPSPDKGTGRPLVLVPGHDRHRDWATAIEAARRMPDADFRFACKPEHLGSLAAKLPRNVRVGQSAGVAELAALYASAAAVLIPLLPNSHASGMTVAIEAMKNRRPIVSNAIGGLAEFLDPALHLRYESGDASSLVAALERAAAGTGAARDDESDLVAARGLRGEDYAARLVLLTRELLGGAHDPRVEALSPAASAALTVELTVES